MLTVRSDHSRVALVSIEVVNLHFFNTAVVLGLTGERVMLGNDLTLLVPDRGASTLVQGTDSVVIGVIVL